MAKQYRIVLAEHGAMMRGRGLETAEERWKLEIKALSTCAAIAQQTAKCFADAEMMDDVLSEIEQAEEDRATHIPAFTDSDLKAIEKAFNDAPQLLGGGRPIVWARLRTLWRQLTEKCPDTDDDEAKLRAKWAEADAPPSSQEAEEQTNPPEEVKDGQE